MAINGLLLDKNISDVYAVQVSASYLYLSDNYYIDCML